MKKSFLSFALALSAFVNVAIGQTLVIKGVVKDIKGHPIAGASVVPQNTKNGTSTDTSGVFSINANPGSAFIVSAVGFADTTVSIGSLSASISVVLRQKTSTLNEVVISSPQSQTSSSNEIANEQIIQNTLEDYVKGEQMGAGVKTYSGNNEGGGSFHIITTQNMGALNTGGFLPVFHQPVETKGSRYLMSGWSSGLVVNQFDTIINNESYLLNYDKISGGLLLTQDKQTYIEIDKAQVKSFALKNSEGGYVFERAPLINGSDYFQLLSKGDKYAAYKSIKAKLVKANGVSNGLTEVGNSYDEYVDHVVYYFVDVKNKTVRQFELKKKSIKEAVGLEKEKTDKYFSDHKRDDVDDNFVKGFIAYLNS